MAWRGLTNTKLLMKGFVKQKLPAKVKFALSFSCLATVKLAIGYGAHPFFGTKVPSYVIDAGIAEIQCDLPYGPICLQQHPGNPFDPDASDFMIN